jgi:hypothetical protein
MPTLSQADQAQIQQAFEDEASAVWETIDLSRQYLAAAVQAVDQWIDDNAAAFNAALPEPARTTLTAKQKVKLFFAVAERRWEVT